MAMTQEQFSKAEAALRADPNIGARKVMNACGCTRWAADIFLSTWRDDPSKIRAKAAVLHRVADGLKAEPTPSERATCGFDVGGCGIPLRNVRVAERRPSDSGMRRQLYGLKKSTGYPVDELAAKWGVSQETLRKHAKRLDCLMYVEAGPGDWKHCILHPDTAEAYRKGDQE